MASNPSIRAGRLFLYRDGKQETIMGSFEIEPGGIVHEELDSEGHGFVGVSEKEYPGRIKGPIVDRGNLSLHELQAYIGTITAECATGKRYVMSEGHQVLKLALSVGDGNVPVEFVGPMLDETLAS